MTDRVLQGIGVSPGVAFGPAVVVRWTFPEVPDRVVDPTEVEGEITRLRAAVATVVGQLDGLRQRTLQRAGVEAAGIFDAQIMMAQDEAVLQTVETLIRKNLLAAETAYEFKSLELRNSWQQARSPVVRERVADLTAIQLRMLTVLLGRTSVEGWLGELEDRIVLVAREISPGLTVQLDRDQIVGLISEEGTRTSHAAILAHSLGIPAVMGVAGAMESIASGAVVLLDGQAGTIIIDPDEAEFEFARVQTSRRHKLDLQLDGMVGQRAETPDGTRIVLQGNVDLPEEIELAVRNGAEGVGLLRTEFLVTGRAVLPSEDEQAAYFRRVGAAFGGAPVVVRSYDLGGDKFPTAFEAPFEPNPFLGWRSIRVCLDRPEIFRPQLRAVLRAAAERPLWLMLPMIISLEEIAATRILLDEEATRLRESGIRIADKLPVGVMIETPAAVMLADEIAAQVDFLSVGSNDLTQYTLAVDRGNARLAQRFSPLHPAVLRSLARVREAADRHTIPVSLCGEMASDPFAVVLLMGLGYRRLSAAPPALPLVKWVVRSVPLAAAETAAAEALRADRADQVIRTLRQTVGTYLDLRLLDPAAALPRPSSGSSLPPA